MKIANSGLRSHDGALKKRNPVVAQEGGPATTGPFSNAGDASRSKWCQPRAIQFAAGSGLALRHPPSAPRKAGKNQTRIEPRRPTATARTQEAQETKAPEDRNHAALAFDFETTMPSNAAISVFGRWTMIVPSSCAASIRAHSSRSALPNSTLIDASRSAFATGVSAN